MRKIFFAALALVLVAIPVVNVNQVFAATPPLIAPALNPPIAPQMRSQSQKTAVILSSLDQVYPMGRYDEMITYYLNQAGYKVTTLTNTAVTVPLLLTGLNNYSIVIWRTNTYTWKHVEYWYVGQLATSGIETQYASDFAQGWMNANAGIIGVSLSFFSNHFTSGMLTNVKLMILLSSDSVGISGFMQAAGANTVVFCNGPIDLGFGLLDDLTNQLVASLSMGESIYTAVYNLVSPNVQNQVLEDPLDSNYSPPFWFQGNSTLTIT